MVTWGGSPTSVLGDGEFIEQLRVLQGEVLESGPASAIGLMLVPHPAAV